MWQDGVFAGSFSPCPWPGPPCCAQQTTQRDEETCQLLQSHCCTCSFCPSIIPNSTFFLSLSFFLHLSLYSCASLLYSLSLIPNKMKWGLSWPSSSAPFFVQVIVLRVQGEAPECLCVTWLLGTRKFTLRPRITGNDLAPKADAFLSEKLFFFPLLKFHVKEAWSRCDIFFLWTERGFSIISRFQHLLNCRG